MLHRVILVIFPGLIKLTSLGDLRCNGMFPFSDMIKRSFDFLRRLVLFLTVIEEGRTILYVHVVMLTVERRRVVHSEEVSEQLFVSELVRLENH